MKNKEQGVAIIEFALILPLLLILTFITTEFGRALYQYNTITKSVGGAARYLSMQDSTDTQKTGMAKNLVVCGNPQSCSGELPLAIGLSVNQVDIKWTFNQGASPSINVVTIKVTGYKFKPLISVAFGIKFGDTNGEIPYGDISATMRSQS